MSRPVALLGVLLLLLGTGCTTKTEIRAADPAQFPTSREPSPHNHVDAAYARSLGVLHEQAVYLADLPDGEVATTLRDLTDRVRRTRIPWMTSLDVVRHRWGVEPHEGELLGIPGELTAQQLAELSALEGAEFEERWLEQMIANYRSSLALSEDELLRGLNSEGRQYAEQILGDLRADLAALERHAER
jgi:uncharacterized protein (DUF305 family)